MSSSTLAIKMAMAAVILGFSFFSSAKPLLAQTSARFLSSVVAPGVYQIAVAQTDIFSDTAVFPFDASEQSKLYNAADATEFTPLIFDLLSPINQPSKDTTVSLEQTTIGQDTASSGGKLQAAESSALLQSSPAATPGLSLSSSVVSPGVYQITLSLTDSSDDGDQLAGYDTNIFIDNTYLSFVPLSNGKLYNPTDTADFPNLNLNPTSASNQIRVSYGADYPGATNHGTIDLGYFQVQTVSPLPSGGTAISLGQTTPGQDTASAGGSDLNDFVTFSNVLQSTSGVTITSAPEPPGWVSFGLGVVGLAVLTLRVRRRAL